MNIDARRGVPKAVVENEPAALDDENGGSPPRFCTEMRLAAAGVVEGGDALQIGVHEPGQRESHHTGTSLAGVDEESEAVRNK